MLDLEKGVAALAAVDDRVERVFLVTPGIDALKPCFV
jgi:hypothetical protein